MLIKLQLAAPRKAANTNIVITNDSDLGNRGRQTCLLDIIKSLSPAALQRKEAADAGLMQLWLTPVPALVFTILLAADAAADTEANSCCGGPWSGPGRFFGRSRVVQDLLKTFSLSIYMTSLFFFTPTHTFSLPLSHTHTHTHTHTQTEQKIERV